MGLRISVVGSFVAAIGSTLLFKAVDAKPEVVVLVYAVIAFVGGAGIGIFAEQIPEPPKWLRDLSRDKPHKS
jgi:hypothetical protein